MDFHAVYHGNQRGKVLLLDGRFVVQIADQGGVKKGFCLLPERVPAL